MTRRFDHQFQKEVVTIHPGEYYATREDLLIGTILGSCVAVALWDEQKGIGGLNHFMLAYANAESNGSAARFGIHAMELLINDLMKLGSHKKDLRAKVFGGGSILQNALGSHMSKIPQENIHFALEFLNTEGIPVLAHDVGGVWPRKIFYFPKTAKVLLKRITKQIDKIVEADASYMEKAKKQILQEGTITLF